MTRKQLMKETDCREIMKWMAYEMSIDKDNKKRYELEIAEENAARMTNDERSEILRNMINLAGA